MASSSYLSCIMKKNPLSSSHPFMKYPHISTPATTTLTYVKKLLHKRCYTTHQPNTLHRTFHSSRPTHYKLLSSHHPARNFTSSSDSNDNELTELSIIEYASKYGAEALANHTFPQRGGFDNILSGMMITEMNTSDGIARGEVECTKGMSNSWGTMHGGAICLLMDVYGTLALLCKDPKRGGVSIEMNQTFLSPCKVGETLVCEGRVIKSGKTMGFTEITLRRKSDEKIVAIGRHTKVL